MMHEPSRPEMIRLDDLLKRRGLVGSGGEAKVRIQCGEVRVNGEVETRRRKQLHAGDLVEFSSVSIRVEPSDISTDADLSDHRELT